MSQNTQQNNNTPATYQQIGGTAQMQKNNASYLKVLDVLMVFVAKWYWFVICLVLAAIACKAYLLYTPPLYSRQASILIKNEAKGSDAISGMSFLGNNVDVNNELFTLRSPTIADAVVRQLHLEVNYWAQGRFHEEVIYGNSLAIQVLPLELNDNEYAEFFLDLKRDNTVVMRNFSRNGQAISSKALAAKVGQTVKTPIGKVEIKSSGLKKGLGISLRIERVPLYYAVNEFMKSMTVSAQSQMSTIINLQYEDRHPRRAEDVLATTIAVYSENWVKDRNRMTVGTSEFIKERLKVIEDELGTVDSDISSFKSANLIPASSSDVAGIYVGQASSATAQSTELNNQLYMARYVRNYLTNEANRYQLIPANQGLASANLSGQVGEYNALLRQRNNLLNASSLQNPIVQDYDVQLAELRNALIASIDNHIASLNTSLRSTHTVKSIANSKIASSPTQSQYLLSAERQQKVKESLYLFLLQKREENELSQAFTAYNSRVITPATGSNKPTFPDPIMVWSIGGIAGLVLPGVLIFIGEMINNKVRGRRDLNELTIPFIGEIPMHRHHRTWKEKLFGPWKKIWSVFYNFFKRKKEKEDKSLHILVKERSRNIINEAFRVIRTNIEFMTAKGERGKVVMLTSFNPNSGKTFVASNLIMSFAIKKKRSIAIDLDLRKASLSAMVDKPKIGVSDYLSGVTNNIDDIIVKGTQHEYLDIIPVGTIPPNPTELLFDERLTELIETLKDKYEYIFLDCPPVEIVADASIVGRNADMTLFLIRAELLDRSLLPDIQKYYDDQRLPKMSVILNGTTDAFSYYGYHRYGSRYGYYGSSYYGGYTHED